MKRTYQITINGKTKEVHLLQKSLDSLSFEVDGEIFNTSISSLIQSAPQPQSSFTNSQKVSTKEPSISTSPGVVSPIPGIVTKVLVNKGQSVKKGEVILVIEAMKMENSIFAQKDCIITEILVVEGNEVKKGQMLATIN